MSPKFNRDIEKNLLEVQHINLSFEWVAISYLSVWLYTVTFTQGCGYTVIRLYGCSYTVTVAVTRFRLRLHRYGYTVPVLYCDGCGSGYGYNYGYWNTTDELQIQIQVVKRHNINMILTFASYRRIYHIYRRSTCSTILLHTEHGTIRTNKHYIDSD